MRNVTLSRSGPHSCDVSGGAILFRGSGLALASGIHAHSLKGGIERPAATRSTAGALDRLKQRPQPAAHRSLR